MSYLKQGKDYIVKIILGQEYKPTGLFELSQYFRNNRQINFDNKFENSIYIAISKDFRYGSIVTQAKSKEELDEKVVDAILTSFDVPSVYKKEAGIHRVSDNSQQYSYALA